MYNTAIHIYLFIKGEKLEGCTWESLKGKEHLDDLDVNGTIILKLILG
jgi:hypothetical protein